MPPKLIYDLSQIDLNNIVHDANDIEAVNPHRGHMRQLDGICFVDEGPPIGVVGFKDVREDEFWVEGHIPGRPLLPGVLMIEAAAQLAAFLIKKYRNEQGFLGFVGCDDFKFRSQVTPGHRLYIMGKETQYKPGRRFECSGQGVVDGTLVFEGSIKGMSF